MDPSTTSGRLLLTSSNASTAITGVGTTSSSALTLHHHLPQPSTGNWIHSCDLESRLRLKIGSLEGRIKRPDYERILEDPLLQFSGVCQQQQLQVADLQAEVQLWDRGVSICPPVTTSYKHFGARWNWNEWLTLPLRFSDLPRTALLCITIYDCVGPEKVVPVGGTTIGLFGKNALFRQGMMDLRIWPGQAADGSPTTVTPGKGPKDNRMYRLHKLTKKHRQNQLPKVDWLDRLAFAEIEALCEREKRESDFMFLNIEFPTVEYLGAQYAILFYEKNYEDLDMRAQQDRDPRALSSDAAWGWLPDHEILLDNLVEGKHHALSRCTRTGAADIELKPNAAARDALNAIVSYPPTKNLSAEEQDLVWKFRYYLCANKRALAKFLKCVTWDIAEEERQSLELVEKWAPVDAQDALELLGPQFKHPAVRKYAVSRLAQSSDEDLLMYLLQLVQALKYENFEQIRDGLTPTPATSMSGPSNSSLPPQHQSVHEDAMDTSASASAAPTSFTTPQEPGVTATEAPKMRTTASIDSMSEFVASTTSASGVAPAKKSPEDEIHTAQLLQALNAPRPDLATFLIRRACENTTLVNYFYWYLVIECEDHDVGAGVKVGVDPAVREMYMNVMKRFLTAMKRGKPEWQQRRALLSRQQKLIGKLVEVVKQVAKENASRPKKIERLQALLGETERAGTGFSFTRFDPLPFSLDPDVLIQGVVARKATLFKSSQMPCKLTFSTANGGPPYVAIFKHGDDLRQDQLILQIITLMDRLLRKENLDLQLTPYRVLATSTTHGFVQYIPSTTVADVLAVDGSIHNFFRKHNPPPPEGSSAPYGIAPRVMETYVRSCAGYCVITYLLGVGDRHLDNLLLTRDGRLFHIDFGYILGRDPKPMPPPMKLSKEMVEAMGGLESEHYQEFRKLCYTAYLHLRRHANLILNLFSLMVGASVPDIALEPDKTVKKVLDKFRLDLNDEGAVKHMQELIDVSVTAFMPALLEQMHKFTQILRK